MGGRLRNAHVVGTLVDLRNLTALLALSYLADTRVNVSMEPH